MGALYQPIDLDRVAEFFNIKHYVETGTGHSDTLSHVLEVRSTSASHSFDVYSVELDDELLRIARERFVGEDNLHLIQGYSHEKMPEILKQLSPAPALFFHDAHFPEADIRDKGYASELDPVKRIPLESEVRAIINSGRDISGDVFVVDDLRIYKDAPFQGGSWGMRSSAGANGIPFIYELFVDTHRIFETLHAQGFILMFPRSIDLDTCIGFILGGTGIIHGGSE